MSFASTVFRRATSVWSGGDTAATVTSSLIVPVWSAKSRLMEPAASSGTFWRLVFLKPVSSAMMS